MPPDEVDTAERLDRYLDGLVRGRFPGAAGLDPPLTAAVRRVHASGAAPVPDAAFVARLEEEPMHARRDRRQRPPPARSPARPIAAGTRLQDLNREAPTAYAEDDGTRWRLFRVETGQQGWLREAEVEPFRSGTTADRAAPTEAATPDGTPPAARADPSLPETPAVVIPTHRVREIESINLRPGPSFENPPLRALAPGTPLQALGQEAPTETRPSTGSSART